MRIRVEGKLGLVAEVMKEADPTRKTKNLTVMRRKNRISRRNQSSGNQETLWLARRKV